MDVAASSPPPPPASPLDLEITVISAKHLKNVNWRSGTLKPYAAVFIEPDHRLSTRPDDHGATSPVWNERFTLPLTSPIDESFLTVEIFHSRPSETSKPLVGSIRVPLLGTADASPDRTHKFELLRPSGRPHGKVRVRLALRERRSQAYSIPESSPYFSSASAAAAAAAAAAAPPPSQPPPPPYSYSRDYRDFLLAHRYGYPEQFPAYPYYPQQYAVPPPPAWSHFSRNPVPGPAGSPSAPPSAPVDFSYPTASAEAKLAPPPPRWFSDHGPQTSTPNLAGASTYSTMLGGPAAPDDQKPRHSHESGGSVADALGGMSLEEGRRQEAEYPRAPESHNQSFGDYRRQY